jgi:GT2 family glycosyltransferase
MIKPISFCINTANNEKDYILLLLKSLSDNTQIDIHEILVFIDSDNQNTYEELLKLKTTIPSLKVCKNPNPYPIWYQHNISVLFEAAQHDIVCYIQSDMVVGKDFDKHICDNLVSENTIVCGSRIEPPIHPESPEKIVKDFGLSPEEFKYDEFNEFVLFIQNQNKPTQWGHMCPFALHKKVWFDTLGGFDTQFRNSREDGDMIIRMGLCGFDLVQTWKACVYHFTCISSRGENWFKNEKATQYKNNLQSLADSQEYKRFLRKWGSFGLHANPVYDIVFDIELDTLINFDLLKILEPYCNVLYLSDPIIAKQLSSQLEFESYYYNNLRCGYPNEHWLKIKHLYDKTDFTKRVTEKNESINSHDIVIKIKYSELVNNWTEEIGNVINNLHLVIHENEIGEFVYGPLHINIKKKNNLMNGNIKNNNLNTLLNNQKFTFK